MRTFSIVLPVKNGGEYVKQCVQSILSQSIKGFDLLILDNNSDDGTTEWLNSLNDPRVKIFTSSISLSMEANWARIVEISKNEFMTVIGHDDLLHENYLQEMNDLINQYPDAGLYQSHFNFIDENGDFIRKCQVMDSVQTADEFLKCHFLHTLDSMGTGYMFRSKDYDKIGGIPTNYPNLIFADYQLWIQLTALSYKATTDKCCFSYRIHNSVSKKTNGDQYQQAFEQYAEFLFKLSKIDEKIRLTINKYGKYFLMYYCESLCHRILKTNFRERKLRVGKTIDKYISIASILIPGQNFAPRKKNRIKIAEIIDNSFFLRKLFYHLKK